MDPRYRVVAAESHHLHALEGIERAAAVLLEGHAPENALADATAVAELCAAAAGGRLWVAVDADVPVGFALVTMLAPDAPHLQEMDVSPAHMQRGVGTALLQTVLAWSNQVANAPLTLTTFRDVPWNAPFYARHGFTVVESGNWSPAVRALVDAEHAHGLTRTRRVVMQATNPLTDSAKIS